MNFTFRRRWLALLASVAFAAAAGAGGLTTEQNSALTAARAAIEDSLPDVALRQLDILKSGALPAAFEDEIVVLQARALTLRGQYGAMRALLDGRDPKTAEWSPAWRFWRAMARYGMGDMQAALAALDICEQYDKRSVYAPRAARLRAACLWRAGRREEALGVMRTFDDRFGATDEGAANLLEYGRSLASMERWSDARAVFDRLVARGGDAPENAEGRYWQGLALAREGQWDQGWNRLSILGEDQRLSADLRARAWLALSELDETRTNLEAAARSADRAVVIATSVELRSEGTARKAHLWLRNGDLTNGAALVRKVVTENPHQPRAEALEFELASAYLGRKVYDRAEQEYRFCLETFTNRSSQATALQGRAWALWNLQRFAEAMTAFQSAAEAATIPSERETCLIKVGDAAFANQQYKLAAEAYARMRQLFPASALAPQVAFQEAESVARGGNRPAAEALFRGIVRQWPDHLFAERALLGIAQGRESAGLLREALDGYADVLTVFPNGVACPEALLRSGLVAYRLFRFADALAFFERVVREFPKASVAMQAEVMRTEALYMLGRDEAAVGACRAFVETHPDTEWTPMALVWLGEYGWNRGQYADAERWYRQLVTRFPSNALADGAVYQTGRAALKQKEYVRAIECFTQLARDYPASPRLPEARFAQGDALTELGEFARAILI
ncbi:MAG: tetratricopeptide repeat protein, partial [Kiritimatiellia bacterium]